MSEKTTIIRAAHDVNNRFFLMLRAAAQNRNMTFEARGMLAYLLSKPDDWAIEPQDLEQQCGTSRVYGLIRELRKAGHMKLVMYKDQQTKRVVRREYRVYEEPLVTFPHAAEPLVENQHGFSYIDNKDSSVLIIYICKELETESTGYSFASGDAGHPPVQGETTENKADVPQAPVAVARQSPAQAPAKASEKPKQPPTAKGRFTASKYYPVNETRQEVYAKTYTPKTFTPLLEAWAKHGIAPVRGSVLNSDARYATYKLTKPPAKRNPTFDAVAECAWHMRPGFDPEVLNGDGGRVGMVITKLAEHLGKTFNEVNSDAEIAKRVRGVYAQWKSSKPNADPPKDPVAFISAWEEFTPAASAKPRQMATMSNDDPLPAPVTLGAAYDR